MRKIKKYILATAIFVTVGSNAFAEDVDDNIKACDRQPMSTYIEHTCIKDSDFVMRIDYDNFDYMYLMDAVHWDSQAEFDATIDDILANDGKGFRMAKPELYKLLIDEAHKVGTKVIFCFINNYADICVDSVRREKAAKAVALAVKNYDFDGIDIDWEGDIYEHIDKHAAFLCDLRDALDNVAKTTGKKYYLTTAHSIECKYPQELQAKVSDAIDWVNLMSYDIGGCLWRDYATHNTPLKLIKDCVDRNWQWLPRNKLHLGLAGYGFIYKGILPGEVLPKGQTLESCGRYIVYNEALYYIYNNRWWEQHYDPEERVSYFMKKGEKEFITIETPQTLAEKFEYAAEAGLGGTFWWEYRQDIVPDKDGGYKWTHLLMPTHKLRTISSNK